MSTVTLYTIIVSSVITLLGPAMASFFAVRVMRAENLTKAKGQRSQCDHCGHPLTWRELIPVFSYLWQRGRCRWCSKRISPTLLVAEVWGVVIYALVGVFLVHSANQGASLVQIVIAAVVAFIVTTLLFYLAVFDILTFSIPARFVFMATLAVVVLNVVVLVMRMINRPLVELLPMGYPHNLMVGVVSAVAIWTLILVTKQKGMGVGDIYIALMIGLALGWPLMVSAFYITIFSGTAAGLVYALYKKRWRGLQVPLVPFLLLGYVGALAAGGVIFDTLFRSL